MKVGPVFSPVRHCYYKAPLFIALKQQKEESTSKTKSKLPSPDVFFCVTLTGRWGLSLRLLTLVQEENQLVIQGNRGKENSSPPKGPLGDSSSSEPGINNGNGKWWACGRWLQPWIKRCLFLGRKAMTILQSILKSRDFPFPTKVHLVHVRIFPVVRYRC